MPVEEKRIPQDIIFLSTLIPKAAWMLSNSSVTTERRFQPFGLLLSGSHLGMLWKLVVSAFLVYLGTFHHLLDKQD